MSAGTRSSMGRNGTDTAAPAPTLRPACPARSRAGSWFLLPLRENQRSAEPPKDFRAVQSETDLGRPAAAADHPHARALRPSCFASKAGRTVPRPENRREHPGRRTRCNSRKATPTSRKNITPKRQVARSKLLSAKGKRVCVGLLREEILRDRAPALFLLRSRAGQRSDQEQ